MLGVLFLATIYAYKEFDGDLNTGWTRIMIGVLVLFFIVFKGWSRPGSGEFRFTLAGFLRVLRNEHPCRSNRRQPGGLGRPVCTTSPGSPGVSHQTVSRVVNSHPSVREDTRRRVQAAISELGYRRNVAARTLVTRHLNTIGVITSVSSFWGPSSTLIAVERAARDADMYVSVAGLRSMEPAGVGGVLRHFVDQGVEGIVVIAPEAAMAHMAEPFITEVPVVMVAAGAENWWPRILHPGRSRPAIGRPPADTGSANDYSNATRSRRRCSSPTI